MSSNGLNNTKKTSAYHANGETEDELEQARR
jgi:hypothetical protein